MVTLLALAGKRLPLFFCDWSSMTTNPNQSSPVEAEQTSTSPVLTPGWNSIEIPARERRENLIVSGVVIAYSLSCLIYTVFTIDSTRPAPYVAGQLFGFLAMIWLMLKADAFRRNTHKIAPVSGTIQADHSPPALAFTNGIAVLGFLFSPLFLTLGIVFTEMGVIPILLGAFWVLLAMWGVNRISLRFKSHREAKLQSP